MRRHWLSVVGVFATALPLLIILTFGFPSAAEPATVLLLGGMILAGLMLVLGGLRHQIGKVKWFQFVGASIILWAVSYTLSLLAPVLNGTSPYDSGIQPFLVLLALAGGASMVFIGADWIRGGHHFDLSLIESGPSLASDKQERRS